MKDMSMKAVKRLGKSCKNLFKMDNARVLLLEMAKDYLNHSQLEEPKIKVPVCISFVSILVTSVYSKFSTP